jgi:hypothetical protein
MGPSAAAKFQAKYFVRADRNKGTAGRWECNSCGWMRTMSSASPAIMHLLDGSSDVPKCTKPVIGVKEEVQKTMFPQGEGAAAAAASIQQTASGLLAPVPHQLLLRQVGRRGR